MDDKIFVMAMEAMGDTIRQIERLNENILERIMDDKILAIAMEALVEISSPRNCKH